MTTTPTTTTTTTSPTLDVTTLLIFLRYLLVDLGRGEFGEQVLGEVAHVVAEAPDGRRWAHFKTFQIVRGGIDPDGDGFVQRIEDADQQAAAERFVAKVQKVAATGKWEGPEDSSHWNVVQPVYGSAAYSADAGRWELEMMDDEEQEGQRKMGR